MTDHREAAVSLKSVHLHKGDLPDGLSFGDSVAVDTEAMGLIPARDRLCLVQLSAGDGVCHLVQLETGRYEAPNLRALLIDPSVQKIFHYARFDLAVIRRFMGIMCRPLFCTKVASHLVRTYTDKHGLKDLCREIVGVDLSKVQQSSDWGAPVLSEDQMAYAASDVLYLHIIRDWMVERLRREGRSQLAEACFAFLPIRAELDLAGWAEHDIFAH